MRKVIFGLITLLLYFAASALAQDCDKVVADYNGALKGREAQVEQAAQALINEGADVRIRVVGITANLDMDEKQFQKSCPSWQSADGGMKNTMIVMMASPVSRKMGMYYGSNWHKALDEHWVRIKQESMAPRFRDGDFAGGFLASETQLAARLKESKSEALHPNQTVNQATDLTGLWTVMKWGLGIAGLSAMIVFLFWFFGRKRREEEAISQAQQSGAMYKARVSALISDARDNKEQWVDNWTERFSEMSQSEKLNPDTPGLSKAEYETIAEQWKDFYEAVYNLRLGSSMAAADRETPSFPPKVKHHSKHVATEREVAASTGAASSVASGNSIFAPVIINESTYEETHEERHSRRRDDDDEGSSSNYSSGSSSSSDSGGSSDFGSSDSGSGGSSDFGSSDSGSGGSSDF